LPAGERLQETPANGTPRTRVKRVSSDGVQTEVQLSFETFAQDDPDHHILRAVVALLEDGMTGRLRRRLSDELGLVYDVGAGLEFYSDTGLIQFEATVSHQNLLPVIEQFAVLADELKNTPVSDVELAHLRQRDRWELTTCADNAAAMGHWYAATALCVEPESLEHSWRGLAAVAASDIQRLARRIFCFDRAVAGLVGVVGRKRKRQIADQLSTSLGN